MVSCRHLISDFANLFKAFIGSNYLSISFAFRQSGMGIGIFILVTMVLLTEHCCNLIVICKRLMLRKVYTEMPQEEDGTESAEIMETKALMDKKTNMGDIGEYTYGRVGRALVNAALFITQFGFCVNYFIFVGTTLSEIFPYTNKSCVVVNHDHNLTFNTTVFEDVSSAPNLILLILTPLPIFIVFSLLRSVRKLGFISVIANISIFVGCVVIFCYIVIGFTVNETFVWANWATAPITLGLVISAFEGIGTILPIEGSMVGNQHNFRKFLIGGIGGVAFILSVFGVMGYLRYGDETAQLLVKNIPKNSLLSSIVDVTLIVGVIFTFPLQQVPVVTMIESILFTRGGLLRREQSEEKEPLIGNGEINSDSEYGSSSQIPETETVEDNPSVHMDKYIILAPNWQRAIVRILVVLAELGVAIAMRYKYAYVSSFTGALGSTFLAFIVPCACHLRLAWHEMNIGIKIKDIFVVILGILMSSVSLAVTVKEIVMGSDNTSSPTHVC